MILNMNKNMLYQPEHLGDGLYAEWDGYYLKLMANDPNDPTDTVYLEDYVIDALLRFIERLQEDSGESS